MILIGIGLYPSLHYSVTRTPGKTAYGTAANIVHEVAEKGGPVNPAGAIRTMCLLITLMRGGLSVKVPMLKKYWLPLFILAIIPYAFEMVAEALLAPHILPASLGFKDIELTVPMFLTATTWAPLSPSIVIPNMLAFLELGTLNQAAQLLLMCAPLEASTALVTEGVLTNIYVSSHSTPVVLGHIPTFIIGSALYGYAFAIGAKIYHELRKTELAIKIFGKIEPTDGLASLILVYLLCYTTSFTYNTPWLVPFFCATSCAMAMQFLMPALGDSLVVTLKPVWTFAEFFLFTLTGCIIRPAIDQGDPKALFGNMLGLLLLGQCARFLGDCLVGMAWQGVTVGKSPWRFNRQDWIDAGARTCFAWCTTIPKAAIQATLGPNVGKAMVAAGLVVPGTFVPPSAAVAILYMASIGVILTKTLGLQLGQYIEGRSLQPGSTVIITVAKRSVELRVPMDALPGTTVLVPVGKRSVELNIPLPPQKRSTELNVPVELSVIVPVEDVEQRPASVGVSIGEGE